MMAITTTEFANLTKTVKSNPTAIQSYEKYIDDLIEKLARYNVSPVVVIWTREPDKPNNLPELNYKDVETLADIYLKAGWRVNSHIDGRVELRR
jgi:hypothetical protein